MFNKNEIENKLKDFKEGQDYSVAREGKKLIYNFHNNWLRDEFGRNWTTVYEVAENWDSDNFNHHREEGKYINNDKGTEITYRYEHRINKDLSGYREWSWGQNFEDNSKATWTLRGRPAPNNYLGNSEVENHHKYLAEFQEKKHNLEMINIEEQNNPKSCCEEHLQAWLKNPNRQKLIEERKKDIEVLETKIQYEKDWLAKNSNFDIKPAGCCNCGRKINHSEVYWYDKGLEDRYALCSSDCKEKFINDSGKSDLQKENQELRQELSEVKNQLAQVLDELKKLKLDVNGKGSEKLEQQIVKNEKLIKDSENISVAEIQEQVNKSQALMNEFNTTASSTKNDKGNGLLPYVIGGSVILASAGIIGYFLLKKNKRK